MKPFSIWSLGFIISGLLLFGLNWIIEGYFESIVLIGVICLLVGIILSFIAIAKNEEGRLKFVSLISFFIVLFLITCFEPFQIIRIMTWLKNI
ncbi:hypothetical protein QRY07_00725 (plasmid) [Bacillus cereus]|uniref:hypothetical protein n=1 Tax=Bacillus cereus TaxID=1396 RepID=UPI00256FA7E7|nr:hypothetical protein [Bacillus cereus]WJE17862.1 hypothetical protein QRY07_00725 [Bacillus cereus]